MKSLKLLISIFLVCPLFAVAQTVEVKSLQKVDLPQPAFHPVLTDGGSKMLTTAADYSGLQEVDLLTGKITVISKEEKAGYNLQSSKDKKIREKIQAQPVYAVSENLKISIYGKGGKRVLTPNGDDCRYIWPSVSPDGTKLLYTVSGKGTYVCGIDGSNPVALGILRAPEWVDNEWVVGMNNVSTNRIVKSSVDIVKADGTCRQTLTPESIVATYPSAAGSRVAFCTESGDVYVMEISINK